MTERLRLGKLLQRLGGTNEKALMPLLLNLDLGISKISRFVDLSAKVLLNKGVSNY